MLRAIGDRGGRAAHLNITGRVLRPTRQRSSTISRRRLAAVRQRWLERICDDQVRGEDMLRFLVESAHSAAKKAAPPKPGDE